MGRPIRGAEITLLCGTGRVCGVTKTDSLGEFMFKALLPGDYSILVKRAGFYLLNEPGYTVWEGLESICRSAALELCPHANCDPRLRPERPRATCD